MAVYEFSHLQNQLGVMTWPLLVCGFIALMIWLERSALLLHHLFHSLKPSQRAWITKTRQCPANENTPVIAELLQGLSQHQDMLAQGTLRLLHCRTLPRNQRDELLSLWLMKQQQQLQAGLKVMHVIGIIAPLLGLLGTVLGLIDMFSELGHSNGSVTPAQLSSGLGLAMNTTAAGLLIAVPALTAAHLFTLWSQGRLEVIAHMLNQINLWIDGVDAFQLNDPSILPRQKKSPRQMGLTQ